MWSIAWLANHSWKIYSTKLGSEHSHGASIQLTRCRQERDRKGNLANKKPPPAPSFWLDMAVFQGRNWTGNALYWEITLNLELLEWVTGWSWSKLEGEKLKCVLSNLHDFASFSSRVALVAGDCDSFWWACKLALMLIFTSQMCQGGSEEFSK